MQAYADVFARLMRLASRDFRRAAVFFLRVFIFAALSIALYAAGSFASAPATSPAVTSFSTSFVAVRTRRVRRRLNTRFRSWLRTAFFAPFVIGIVRITVTETLKKASRVS